MQIEFSALGMTWVVQSRTEDSLWQFEEQRVGNDIVAIWYRGNINNVVYIEAWRLSKDGAVPFAGMSTLFKPTIKRKHDWKKLSGAIIRHRTGKALVEVRALTEISVIDDEGDEITYATLCRDWEAHVSPHKWVGVDVFCEVKDE